MSTCDLFPYPQLRVGQEAFLRDAREAMQEGRILLAQAPTGLGKTAVALTAAVEAARDTRQKVFFTTARRSQHRIAVETLRSIGVRVPVPAVDLIAREAMCPTHGEHPRPSRSKLEALRPLVLQGVFHAQEIMELAGRFRVCPYSLAFRAARHAKVLICDYNYLFSRIRPRILRALGVALRDCLIVVDEAHNLPDRGREALSAEVTVEALRRLVGHVKDTPLQEALRVLANTLSGEARVIAGESRVPVTTLERLVRRIPDGGHRSWTPETLARALERAYRKLPDAQRPLAEEATRLFHRWKRPGHLRLLSTRDGGALALLALDARPVTQGVFQDSHSAILMSGTLHPGEMYVDVLGLPAHRSTIRSYPPTFPAENRLLLLSRRHSSAYRERPGCYRGFAQEIDGLCHAIPGNVAAFFPSYAMARRVGSLLQPLRPPKALLWERRERTKAQKERVLQALDRYRRAGCLLLAVQGGSFSEGIDYPGDLLNGVIVVGLALLPPQLPVEALRSFYTRRFGRRRAYEYAYLYPALNRLVQCAGRCIRSPTDVGAIVILDRRLRRPFYRNRLPLGFDLAESEELASTVRTFFKGRLHRTALASEAGRRGRPHPDPVEGPGGGDQVPETEGLPPTDAG